MLSKLILEIQALCDYNWNNYIEEFLEHSVCEYW